MRLGFPLANWRVAGTTSDQVSLLGNQLVGFYTPADLSGSSMTFQGSDSPTGTFVDIKDSGGSAISFTVGVSGYYGFSADQIAKFAGVGHVKLKSGSSEAAGRNVKLVILPYPRS